VLKISIAGTDLNIKDTTAGSVKPGLLRLKSIGWNPTRVLDVGANVGDWSRVVKDVYPDAEVFMIEGSETCAQDLMTTGNAFVISLVGKEDSTIEFYESKKGTGNSIYKEKTKYFSSVLPTIKPIYTLDTLTAHLPPVEVS
jgi:FkbM family methyltransferase